MNIVNTPLPSNSLQTYRKKRWSYDEYYFGGKDSEDRKNGLGENHWTGAESIEWYVGRMFRDTMHGEGEYRWRYKGPDNAFVTYEGQFFANHIHGYGIMSYPDGRKFKGLFFNDVRWGPGEERTADVCCSVGLWCGTKLARLSWRPDAPAIAPDLTNGPSGASYLDQFRVVLKKNTEIIGSTNPAIDLLKKFDAQPLRACKMWTKLYSKYCTDMDSALCHKDLFKEEYYSEGKICTLKEVMISGTEDVGNTGCFFAWNNNPIMLHMMKHSYQHDHQRDSKFRLDLGRVLNGPRKKFRPAAKHEFDCRNLLMASYLGHITNVVQLVNDEHVFVDVADSQGNTPLMYAVVGDQIELIHFLIEAGANVNSYNDSCCTPLGVALMRYLCVARDIPPLYMPQVLLPLKSDKPSRVENQPNEWYILRKEFQKITDDAKRSVLSTMKSVKSMMSRQPEELAPKELPKDDRDYESFSDFHSEEKDMFLKLNGEFISKMNILFAAKTANYYTVKIFTTKNMLDEIDSTEEELINPKQLDKPHWAKEVHHHHQHDANTTQDEAEKDKSEALSKVLLTINQLLKDGADPKLVKVPQPAILMATKSGIPQLIQHMVSHGVDVNETFPDFLDYTALDLVVAEPFNDKNLELIRVLLEGGAETSHRLNSKYSDKFYDLDHQYEVPDGPTLLHVVIARKTNTEEEAQIQRKIIELLLQYNANPYLQFNGRSPIEYAMLKGLAILDIFISNSSTNLNSIINQQQHTILVKLFSREYLMTLKGIDKISTLTNLLLFGADPLIECYDGDDRYENLFEFASKILNNMDPPPPPVTATLKVTNIKGRSVKIKGKSEKSSDKSEKSKDKVDSKYKMTGKKSFMTIEYREVLDILRQCSQLLHVRWLQAQLLKELTDIIYRFKPRHWAMIMKQYNNGQKAGLWLTPPRCLEIWDLLQCIKSKKFKDDNILRKLLCIVQFYHKRVEARRVIAVPCTAAERDTVQAEMGLLMREHKLVSASIKEISMQHYVKPELAYKADDKFKICFECGLRLREKYVTCDICGLVFFCNMDCMSTNSKREANVHPCNDLLIEMHFPPAEDSMPYT